MAEGMDVVTVNPCEVYGPEDTSLVTAGNIVDIYGGPVALVCSGGTAVAHVDDVAEGVVLGFERGVAGERYILGGENLTIQQLAKSVLRLGEKTRPVWLIPNFLLRGLCWLLLKLHLPTPAPVDVLDYAMRYWFVDSSKAKRELGYRYRSADETLEPVVKWLLETGRIR